MIFLNLTLNILAQNPSSLEKGGPETLLSWLPVGHLSESDKDVAVVSFWLAGTGIRAGPCWFLHCLRWASWLRDLCVRIPHIPCGQEVCMNPHEWMFSHCPGYIPSVVLGRFIKLFSFFGFIINVLKRRNSKAKLKFNCLMISAWSVMLMFTGILMCKLSGHVHWAGQGRQVESCGFFRPGCCWQMLRLVEASYFCVRLIKVFLDRLVQDCQPIRVKFLF